MVRPVSRVSELEVCMSSLCLEQTYIWLLGLYVAVFTSNIFSKYCKLGLRYGCVRRKGGIDNCPDEVFDFTELVSNLFSEHLP